MVQPQNIRLIFTDLFHYLIKKTKRGKTIFSPVKGTPMLVTRTHAHINGRTTEPFARGCFSLESHAVTETMNAPPHHLLAHPPTQPPETTLAAAILAEFLLSFFRFINKHFPQRKPPRSTSSRKWRRLSVRLFRLLLAYSVDFLLLSFYLMSGFHVLLKVRENNCQRYIVDY